MARFEIESIINQLNTYIGEAKLLDDFEGGPVENLDDTDSCWYIEVKHRFEEAEGVFRVVSDNNGAVWLKEEIMTVGGHTTKTKVYDVRSVDRKLFVNAVSYDEDEVLAMAVDIGAALAGICALVRARFDTK